MKWAAALAALLLAPATAAQPTWWAADPAQLERGDAEGMGVSSRGRLFLAPRLAPVARPVSAGSPAQVWSAVADASGNVFLGTGPDGRIVRVSPSGQQSVFFVTREPLVTALALLPSGELLAGTAPEGRIYRVAPDGRGSVWCETKSRYVWSLAAARDGTVFAGTGERGIIFRIDRSGTPAPFFDGDDAHIVSLALLPDGAMLAGGAGRGLVYRIAPDGTGRVVHDDDLPEARAVMAEPDGSIVAAFVAPPEPDRRPPAVRIQMAGGNQVTAAGDPVSDLDDRSGGATLQGVIEGLPDEAPEPSARTRGRVVRISREGSVTELWRSSTDAPYALTADAAGRPIVGLGEPARLLRLEGPSESSLLATLREGQVTALVRSERTILAATANPASVYRLERELVDSGSFTARPLDAGGIASWGTLRWNVDGAPGRVEFSTRTGNTEQPDGTWSAWSSPATVAAGSAVTSPAARFLQWRARIFGAADGSVGGASVSYDPANRPPSVRDFRLEPAIRATGAKAAFRWMTFDPDGDAVTVEVQVKRPDSATWTTATRLDPPAPKPGEPIPESDPSWREGRASWDAASADEATYAVRAVASDRASNPPGAAREALAELAGNLVVDRTPPEIRAKPVGNAVEVVVEDRGSGVVRFEVVADGRALFAPLPADGVLDGTVETFRIAPAESGAAGPRVLRAVDAAGNVTEAPVPVP